MTDKISKARCSYCNRGADDGLECLIHSRFDHSNICEDCSTGIFMTFKRQQQLKEQAAKLSADLDWENNRRDEDGNCNCPGCTYQRMVVSDHVLEGIARTMMEYAITGEETTGQTRH